LKNFSPLFLNFFKHQADFFTIKNSPPHRQMPAQQKLSGKGMKKAIVNLFHGTTLIHAE
jgi:hypothetical protein